MTGNYGESDAERVENVMLQYWDAKDHSIKNITSGTKEYRNVRWSTDATQLASASEALRIWSVDGA